MRPMSTTALPRPMTARVPLSRFREFVRETRSCQTCCEPTHCALDRESRPVQKGLNLELAVMVEVQIVELVAFATVGENLYGTESSISSSRS